MNGPAKVGDDCMNLLTHVNTNLEHLLVTSLASAYLKL
jgi:hypothetical protein